jgi:osmotically-inducible protein OsmY
VTGVRGLANHITLRERKTPEYLATRIQDALARHAQQEAQQIQISVDAHTATLRGTVSSLAQSTAAQSAAWTAPGISRVVNELRVQPQ